MERTGNMALQNKLEGDKKESMCKMVSIGIALYILGASASGDNTRLGFASCLCSRIATDNVKIDRWEGNSMAADGGSTLQLISDIYTFSSVDKRCCKPAYLHTPVGSSSSVICTVFPFWEVEARKTDHVFYNLGSVI